MELEERRVCFSKAGMDGHEVGSRCHHVQDDKVILCRCASILLNGGAPRADIGAAAGVFPKHVPDLLLPAGNLYNLLLLLRYLLRHSELTRHYKEEDKVKAGLPKFLLLAACTGGGVWTPTPMHKGRRSSSSQIPTTK